MTPEQIAELLRQHVPGIDQETLASVANQTDVNQALQMALAYGLPPEVADQTPVVEEVNQQTGSPRTNERPLYAVEAEPPAPPPDYEGALNRIDLGVPTEEDVTLIQEAAQDPDKFAILEDLLAAQETEQVNYDWVYNALQLKPGSLDSNEALLQLYESMVAVGAMEDAEIEDADKVTQVKELLARSPQVWIVQQGVLDWARDAGVYTPEIMTDGVSNQRIAEIMESTGVSLSRAVTLGKVAEAHDLDPTTLAKVWERQNRDAGEEPGGKPSIRGAMGPSIQSTAERYKSALDEYQGSAVLAAIAISDPELAKKLAANPYSLDSGEIRRALDFVGGPEGQESDPQVSWLVNRLAGAYQVRAEVDDEAVRDAVQTLADSWNLTGSEGVAAALAGRLLSEAVARATAQLPNPFGAVNDPVSVEQSIQDTTAHVKAQLRNLPEYEALFGNMSAGESEEEYVRRFENRSQQVLGDDVVSAVRAGMRSGNVNTIYQQGLLTDVGDSSTAFQEIMARNARILRELL